MPFFCRRRSFFAEGADSKSQYLAIDASLGSDFFKTGFLRLPAFQFAIFLLNFDLKKASKSRFRSYTSKSAILSRTPPASDGFAGAPSAEITKLPSEASDRGAVRFKIADFEVSLPTRDLDACLRSKLNKE